LIHPRVRLGYFKTEEEVGEATYQFLDSLGPSVGADEVVEEEECASSQVKHNEEHMTLHVDREKNLKTIKKQD
jgi:hypothetical protein